MKYFYQGYLRDINELSSISGIPKPTIYYRLRSGYSVEESLQEIPEHESFKLFCEMSYWYDWIGLSINKVYQLYWKMCLEENYNPIQLQHFSRQLFKRYPNLKSVPNKQGRVIRERNNYE